MAMVPMESNAMQTYTVDIVSPDKTNVIVIKAQTLSVAIDKAIRELGLSRIDGNLTDDVMTLPIDESLTLIIHRTG